MRCWGCQVRCCTAAVWAIALCKVCGHTGRALAAVGLPAWRAGAPKTAAPLLPAVWLLITSVCCVHAAGAVASASGQQQQCVRPSTVRVVQSAWLHPHNSSVTVLF